MTNFPPIIRYICKYIYLGKYNLKKQNIVAMTGNINKSCHLSTFGMYTVICSFQAKKNDFLVWKSKKEFAHIMRTFEDF